MSQKCALADLEQFLPEEKRIKRRIWTNLAQVKEEEMPAFLEFLASNEAPVEPAMLACAEKAYVLKGPDGMIGGGVLCRKGEAAFLAALTVREADRRKKYGEILLNKMMKVLRESGAESAYVITGVPAFYHRFAFFPAETADAASFEAVFGTPEELSKPGRILMKYEL